MPNWEFEYEYNGLHWRTVKRLPGSSVTAERRLFYSASWQLIEERIDDYEEEPDGTDRVAQVFWGVRYIDDAVLRRTDTNNDGDFVDEGDRQDYLLTDAQFSVVAVADRVGRLQERVVYDAYGMARHVWPGDVNGDGGVDGDDLDEISDRLGESIGDTDYVPEADLNRDGQITTQDLLLALGWSGRAALAPGRVSDPDGPDNFAGFCGYIYNPEVGLYTVRFRHYDPWLGRWVRRDPLGYVDGMSLYEYVGSMPTFYLDPCGLWSLWRWLYTGDFNASDVVYDAALRGAADFLMSNANPVRGVVASVQVSGRAGVTVGAGGGYSLDGGYFLFARAGVAKKLNDQNSVNVFLGGVYSEYYGWLPVAGGGGRQEHGVVNVVRKQDGSGAFVLGFGTKFGGVGFLVDPSNFGGLIGWYLDYFGFGQDSQRCP